MLTHGHVTYTIKSLDASSAKYGPCEVCDRPVSDVHYQRATVAFVDENGDIAQTYHNAPPAKFGHESCLLGTRR